MTTVAVNVQRAGTAPRPGELEEDLRRVRQLADLLDAKFQVAGVRFGWDSIVGLVPVVGDVAMAAVGLYPILIARKHGMSKIVRARMVSNLLLDWAVGSVPLVGDLFDVAFKAHLKNAALLERAAEKHRRGSQK